MRALPLFLAGLVGLIGTGQLDAVLQGSTGINISNELAGLGLPLTLNVFSVLALALVLFSIWPQKPKVFVVDFSVFAPPSSWRFPRNAIRPLAEKNGRILPEHIDFLEKIAFRTGLGDDSAVVPAIQTGNDALANITTAREEFAATCFPCVEAVLQKTGVKAKEITFVITNSSLFNPTPSLSTTVMNHFKMSSKAKGYSLGGMGCSAGVIAIDLAKELLELYPNSYALVVSHENISNAFYTGKDPSMLLVNVLFRANGAAILLSNKPKDAGRSKYWIEHLVRTNLAADDVAFGCVQQLLDDEGILGVRLTKDIVKVGTRALKGNMTSLGPKVLPLSEKLKFAGNMATRSLSRAVPALKGRLPESWTRPYTPDFRKAFDHFCIHTGGRGIIDGLEKELKLARSQVEPSRSSLYRFGNTSSTSVWYELAYIESRQGVQCGGRVWQLAFGSGFKFNSSIMVANRKVVDAHKAWDGFDSEAMWVELDALEASAKAARAAKAKKQAEEAAAAATAAATAVSTQRQAETAAAAAVAQVQAAATAPDEPSAFATAQDIAEQLPDAVREGESDQADSQGVDERAVLQAVKGTVSGVVGEERGSVRATLGRFQVRGSLSLLGVKSLKRMPSISRPNSLVAVGSGAVSPADIHHLEEDVDVEVPEEPINTIRE